MADAMNKAVLAAVDPVDGISFPQALQHAMNSNAVARDGWNGSRVGITQRVLAQFPDEKSKMTQPYLFIEQYHEESGVGTRTPWTPSQGDLFANDWRVL
jgi:hypothetical protein